MTKATHCWVAAPMLVAVALGAASCSTSQSALASTETVAPAATLPAPATTDPASTDRGSSSGADADQAPTAIAPVVSPPRQIIVRSIDIDAPIIDLGLTSDGALETPTDFDMAGWWAGGTVADEVGPTVVVGHVDDRNGPAVFFRLQELKIGETIIVVDALGREQVFRVVDKDIYDKASFPTERVYGPSDAPTLRLVTCGGEFDRSERSYESNWVVYAEAVST